jgi:hypothetical protein
LALPLFFSKSDEKEEVWKDKSILGDKVKKVTMSQKYFQIVESKWLQYCRIYVITPECPIWIVISYCKMKIK